MCVQCGNVHFLSLAEVFSIFFPIVTPVGKSPNKKAVKVRCLPLRPKDLLIFHIISLIPHYWALSSCDLKKSLLVSFSRYMALPPTDISPKAVQCQSVSVSPPTLEPKISKPLCALGACPEQACLLNPPEADKIGFVWLRFSIVKSTGLFS
jgi:hypothetical protein